jgi:hypothetical protein
MWAVVFRGRRGLDRAEVEGDAAADESRREHDEIVLDAAVRCNGHVVKSMGDGSMFVFSSPADAVEAAVEVRQAIERQNEPGSERLGLRVRISVGDLTHKKAICSAWRCTKRLGCAGSLTAATVRSVVQFEASVVPEAVEAVGRGCSPSVRNEPGCLRGVARASANRRVRRAGVMIQPI